MPDTEPTPETATETCTYTNPVYKGYFADPFVWEYQGVYYAIGTGAKEAEGQVDEIADAVRVDRSTDELRIFPSCAPATSLPGILPVTRCCQTPPRR